MLRHAKFILLIALVGMTYMGTFITGVHVGQTTDQYVAVQTVGLHNILRIEKIEKQYDFSKLVDRPWYSNVLHFVKGVILIMLYGLFIIGVIVGGIAAESHHWEWYEWFKGVMIDLFCAFLDAFPLVAIIVVYVIIEAVAKHMGYRMILNPYVAKSVVVVTALYILAAYFVIKENT
ncbi:MAG: hypothetical protein A2293_00395 [Elusimicrobia bacterium RIFOXYB2_FULL_49_7]|nr:MAG: hypothetical protein A2293_00395 [Elusimicrobia bacterium RIFOXYB2_FULL_49_7]